MQRLGLFQQAILESGNIFLSLDGNYGYFNTSMMRAQQLCNFTEASWKNGNFTSLKECMMNLNYTDWTWLDTVRVYDQLSKTTIQRNGSHPSPFYAHTNLRIPKIAYCRGRRGGGVKGIFKNFASLSRVEKEKRSQYF